MKYSIKVIIFIIAMLVIGRVDAVDLTPKEFGIALGFMNAANMEVAENAEGVIFRRAELIKLIKQHMKIMPDEHKKEYFEGYKIGHKAGMEHQPSIFESTSNHDLCFENGRILTLKELNIAVDSNAVMMIGGEVMNRLNAGDLDEALCDASMSAGMAYAYKQVRG